MYASFVPDGTPMSPRAPRMSGPTSSALKRMPTAMSPTPPPSAEKAGVWVPLWKYAGTTTRTAALRAMV